MKLIYAQGFSKNEKMEWKPVVFTNIVQSFRLIYDAMNDLGITFENPDNEVSGFWRWLRQPMAALLVPGHPCVLTGSTEKHGPNHGRLRNDSR
jgi:hypothetical protein